MIDKLKAFFRRKKTFTQIKLSLKNANNAAMAEVQKFELSNEQRAEVDNFFSTLMEADLAIIFQWTAQFTEIHFMHILNKKQIRIYDLRHDIASLNVNKWLELQDYILELDGEWLGATHQYLKNMLYENHLKLILDPLSPSLPDAYDMMKNLVLVTPDDDTIN